MIITSKTDFLLRMFCVVILVGLCIIIYVNGKTLTCDNCVIEFKALKRERDSASNEIYQNFSVNLMEIYNSFLINETDCLLSFDTDHGFYYKNASNYK